MVFNTKLADLSAAAALVIGSIDASSAGATRSPASPIWSSLMRPAAPASRAWGGGSMQVACNAGLSPFPLARIIDMSDETKPQLVSNLALDTHIPANCAKVLPDLVGEVVSLMAATFAASITVRMRLRSPVVTGSRGFACSISACLPNRKKSPISTPHRLPI